MVGLSIVLLALAAYQLIETAATPWGQGLIGSDVSKGYLVGAQRFLDTGSPYTDQQIAGPWALDFHSFIHPPAALPLFVPFLVLPLPLWWAIPGLVTLLAIYRLRPAPWTWPLMAACLVWPRSTGAILAGNSDIWAMTAVAAGAVWGWPIVAIAIKPTFAPLALVAVRRRSAWIVGIAGVAVMLPLLPLWFDWLQVIGNARLGPAYSLLNLPLVLIGAIGYSVATNDDLPRAQLGSRECRSTTSAPI
jgi:hypothetical protein